jgi:quinol monooxygenase YgiN
MFVVTVLFKIKEERVMEFLPAMDYQAGVSLGREEGCRRFDVCLDPDDPTRVFLYELYDDKAAFEAHLETDHFKAFDRLIRGWLESKDVATWVLDQD